MEIGKETGTERRYSLVFNSLAELRKTGGGYPMVYAPTFPLSALVLKILVSTSRVCFMCRCIEA